MQNSARGAHSAKVLAPEDAYSIDVKADDGSPQTGKMLAQAYPGYDHSTCISTPVTSASTYDLTNTDKGCNLFFDLW